MTIDLKRNRTASFGLRYSADERRLLDNIQSYFRLAGLKLSDSAVFRAMLRITEVDQDLIVRAREAGESRHKQVKETSVSLGIVYYNKVQKLTTELKRHIKSEKKLKGGEIPSINDVLRALLWRYEKPDLPLQGAGRQIEEEDHAHKQKKRKRA